MKYHTTKDRNRVLELYRSGLSTRKVAAETGVNRQTVNDWCEEAGIIRSKSRSDRLFNAQKNGLDYDALERRAVDLYLNHGRSMHAIAPILGVSRATISRWLDKHAAKRPAGITQGQAQRETSGRGERLWQAHFMRSSGLPVWKIARSLGVSKSVVYAYLRDARAALGSTDAHRYHARMVHFDPQTVRAASAEMKRLIDSGIDGYGLLRATWYLLEDLLQDDA